MRILRIFFKPEGRNWFDYAIPDNMSVHMLESMWRTDGFLVSDSGIAPYSSMLFAYTFDTGQPANKTGSTERSTVVSRPWANLVKPSDPSPA